jgi:pyruvate dehydrogenase E2 component (dihydrolipoamide acetyltransferase)
MELVERLKARRDLDMRISPLLLVCRAMLLAVRRTPIVNATWDGDAGDIVLRRAVNLGVAAATPRGLLVPTVKDADTLSLPELASALADLTLKARSGKISPADLEGGTITVTNIGVFGVDAGTPIINPGQASILAVGAIRPQPWVVEGALAVRQVTTLALSFDHRMVDGAEGSRFLADVGAILSNPGESLLF